MFYDLVHVASVLCLVAQSCPTLCDLMDCSPQGFSVHGDSPGRNTGVGCHALLQGIFPTQGSQPGLPHCRQIPYCLSQQESPRILEWVAYPFSRRSSWPRHWTRVSCIAGVFFTSWATRKAPSPHYLVAHSICPWKDCIPQLLCDVVQLVSPVWLFVTQWTATFNVSCPSLSLSVCSNSCPLSHWCYLTTSSSATLFSFAFNFSQHQGLFQSFSSSHQVAKILALQLQYQSF